MKPILKVLRYPLFILLLLACLSLLLDKMSMNSRQERLIQIEDACRYAALSCYAAEGFYPSDIAYLAEHYRFSRENAEADGYAVFYEAVADNLMPDITVVDLHE